MTLDKKFGNVIWTNHALQRLAERGIKQGDAWATWRNPDQSRYAASKGAWIYYRTFGGTRLEVVAKQNDQPAGRQGKRQWIILSVWSKPVSSPARKKNIEPLWRLIIKKLINKKIFKTSSS